MNDIEDNGQLCSLISQAQGEDPIGSGNMHKRYLFVELPMPWPAAAELNARYSEGLLQVIKQHAKEGRVAKLLALDCPQKRSPEGMARLFYMQHPGFPCAGFELASYVVPEEQVVSLADALIGSEVDAGQLEAFAGWLEAPIAGRRELFVCAHGEHDACCGRFGYPAYEYIQQQYGQRDDVRVWCTTHFGGHRYAPTLIEFPSGRYWANMQREQLDILVQRHKPASELYRHYRGWSMIQGVEQVAERELLVSFGWGWDRYVKQASQETGETDEVQVQIEYAPAGEQERQRYDAIVQSWKTVELSGCGTSGEAKQYRVLAVDSRQPI